MNNNRVRYSHTFSRSFCRVSKEWPDGIRTIHLRKNTLYTVEDGDNIYFGIARCNSKNDVFRKSIGTAISQGRAELAQDESEEMSDVLKDNFITHASGLRGVVKSEDIVDLLEYFDDIDYILGREDSEECDVLVKSIKEDYQEALC